MCAKTAKEQKPLRVDRITLCNFRAFGTESTPIPIDLPDGANLLVYGENGAGKSSLYLALRNFLDASASSQPKLFEPYRNRFRPYDGGYVELRLKVNPELANKACWRWTDEIPTPDSGWSSVQGEKWWIDANICKGFLDYKQLLPTYLLPPNQEAVNLFDILVNGILRDMPNSEDSTRRTLGACWTAVRTAVAQPRHTGPVKQQILSELRPFNDGLRKIVGDLEVTLAEFMRFFGYKIEVKLPVTEVFFRVGERTPIDTQIGLSVRFHDLDIDRHQDFLNEAKLSALALCIFLSGHVLQPTGRIKLLVLDDVLIGLDMSNRARVLDLLKEKFNTYQIIITTYDRPFFEMARRWANAGGCGKWEAIELFAGTYGEFEIPVVNPRKRTLLLQSEEFWNQHHYKAAAVYARTAFEQMLKEFCGVHHVPVAYFAPPKQAPAKTLWDAVDKWLQERSLLAASVRYLVIEAQGIVLNPSAHDDPHQPYATEVMRAIVALKALHGELDAVPKPTGEM